MARVYVMAALLPYGGFFMSYHVALLLHRQFGYDMINVKSHNRPRPLQFEYELIPRTISIAEMEQSITGDDLLVMNPSYSHHMFGMRLPGRKICYVQGFQTYRALDCRLDLYISVSSVVRDLLNTVYGIQSQVIPPFIQLKKMPETLPWHQRPPHCALMYVKNGEDNVLAAQYLKQELGVRVPQLKLDTLVSTNELPHAEFLRRIGAVRYLINVSLAEGFGLVPLEAMALGTCVTGFDGLAGRDYLRFGKNSMTCSLRDVDRVPEAIEKLVQDDDVANAMVQQGIADAQAYGLNSFQEAWGNTLKNFLNT